MVIRREIKGKQIKEKIERKKVRTRRRADVRFLRADDELSILTI